MSTDPTVVGELARVKALFQARTIALVLGAIPPATLAGCSARSDQTRRESMVGACIDRGQSPIECAEAARIAIPTREDVARCQRKAPPWDAAECGGRS